MEAWQFGVERGAKRALILMDATSPVLASRQFRRVLSDRAGSLSAPLRCVAWLPYLQKCMEDDHDWVVFVLYRYKYIPPTRQR